MGIREDLKIPLSMLSINFLDKLNFKGSYIGKRFIFEKKVIENTTKLNVYVWKDLYNFENTDKNDIKIKTFEYSKEGIKEGLDFVESISI